MIPLHSVFRRVTELFHVDRIRILRTSRYIDNSPFAVFFAYRNDIGFIGYAVSAECDGTSFQCLCIVANGSSMIV